MSSKPRARRTAATIRREPATRRTEAESQPAVDGRPSPARKGPLDMLIALYALPDAREPLDTGVIVRAPLAPEHDVVVEWVRRHFTPGWASEARAVITRRPCGVVIAIDGQHILGFCCHDAFARGFVGPIGVADDARGRGVGAALLRASLDRMRLEGYAYAVAGAVGAPDFFARVAGATPIAGSWPGAYRGLLRP